MAYDFRQSLRSVAPPRHALAVIATTLCLLIAWGLWFAYGKVTVYVTAAASRIEVEGAPIPLESAVDGRVLSVALQLGAHVQKGDILLVLDAREAELKRAEQQAQQRAAAARLTALAQQIGAAKDALAQFQRLASVSHGEAAARSRAASAAADLADGEAQRGERLFASSTIAAAEYQRLSSTAVRQRATSEAMEFGMHRSVYEARVGESERAAALGSLKAEQYRIEGEQAERAANIHLLEIEIDKHTLRAPCAGTIGSVTPTAVGARLRAGTGLGSLVPASNLQLVAQLSAAEALGRVHTGQRARLRLDGFPWTQFGTVELSVARIAEEASAGKVRTEFTTSRASARRIPLQHGLSGSVEIEVDHVTPAWLVMRRFATPLGVVR